MYYFVLYTFDTFRIRINTCIRIFFVLKYDLSYNDIAKLTMKLNKEETNMAYVISDSCVSCGTCEGECPVGAISQGDSQYEINADSCVDCGTCAGVCPVGAISQG